MQVVYRRQVRNLLYEASTTSKSDKFTTMKAFIDARLIDEILSGFLQEGWLEKSSNGDFTSLGLTDPGMAEREVIFKQQSEVRRRA